MHLSIIVILSTQRGCLTWKTLILLYLSQGLYLQFWQSDAQGIRGFKNLVKRHMLHCQMCSSCILNIWHCKIFFFLWVVQHGIEKRWSAWSQWKEHGWTTLFIHLQDSFLKPFHPCNCLQKKTRKSFSL
jgi:hypothetical protein